MALTDPQERAETLSCGSDHPLRLHEMEIGARVHSRCEESGAVGPTRFSSSGLPLHGKSCTRYTVGSRQPQLQGSKGPRMVRLPGRAGEGSFHIHGSENSTLRAILPKLTYRFDMIQSKSPLSFCRNQQTDPKIHVEIQKIRNGCNAKRHEIGDLYFLISKLTIKKLQ